MIVFVGRPSQTGRNMRSAKERNLFYVLHPTWMLRDKGIKTNSMKRAYRLLLRNSGDPSDRLA